MKHHVLNMGFITLIIVLGLFSDAFNSNNATGGETSIQVQTATYGGKYADKNIGAIWIENAQNQFVKSIKVWANKRIKHLVKWNASSGQNVVDAVTSATIRSHELHNATWNGTDVNGNIVPDGNYKIFVEFAEHNAASSGQAPGKWLAIDFIKGSAAQSISPADQTYFKNIKLTYNPSTSTPPASLSGSVKDAVSNNAVENATLQLKSGNVVQFETNSNVSGLYSFNNIQAGNYTLNCIKAGYDNWTGNVSISAGEQITNKDISLILSTDSTPPSPPVNVKVVN